MCNNKELLRNEKGFWRVTKLYDPDPESPRDSECNAGTMVCWHPRCRLGDPHEYKNDEQFFTEMLTKLAGAAPYFGAPVYDFIAAGKADNVRFHDEGGKRMLSTKWMKTEQTEESKKRTAEAIKDMREMVEKAIGKKHPITAPLSLVCDLNRRLGIPVDVMLQDAATLWSYPFTDEDANKSFVTSLEGRICRMKAFVQYHEVPCWENCPETAVDIPKDGEHYPDSFLDECIEMLSVKEMLTILCRSALAAEIVILPLFLYDHSGLSISTTRIAYPFNDRWDTSAVGWIYVLRKDFMDMTTHIAIDGTPRRIWRDDAVKWLNEEVETYDNYLSGAVYCVTVEKFNCPQEGASDEEVARLAKENFEDGSYYETVESGDGFYGYDDGKNGIDRFIKDIVGSEYEVVA